MSKHESHKIQPSLTLCCYINWNGNRMQLNENYRNYHNTTTTGLQYAFRLAPRHSKPDLKKETGENICP